jgi:predicted nucleotidyltransferase
MRLSQLEKDVLIANAIGQFGSQTALYLFGSRVNDQSKGGDIDVLIVPGNNMNASNLYHKKIQFLVKSKG